MAGKTEAEMKVASLSGLVRWAEAADWPAARRLLSSADLPVEDLGEDRLAGFFVAEIDGVIVGLIGLERFGTVGLLRSLVVREDTRRGRLGRKLVAAVETAAQAAGIDELWLLTIDAERYFDKLGYEIADRDAAPDAIRDTQEFSALCPGNAHVMRKRIE